MPTGSTPGPGFESRSEKRCVQTTTPTTPEILRCESSQTARPPLPAQSWPGCLYPSSEKACVDPPVHHAQSPGELPLPHSGLLKSQPAQPQATSFRIDPSALPDPRSQKLRDD